MTAPADFLATRHADAGDPRSSLQDLIRTRSALVAIIGLGYVGLPLALAALSARFRVLGFDINAARVEALNRGEPVARHIPTEALHAASREGRFAATHEFSRLNEPDVVLICVPTPLTRQREPDMSFIEATAHAIAARLRPGQLVVLESTTWPGTTQELLLPLLEAGGLRQGVDFFLAFSPEREDPGNAAYSTSTIPKVVGGEGAASLELATALYDALVVRTVPVASTATAEAVKLTENIFRAVNIALVNELKGVYGAMGIDVWDVIEAAKTKPFGFMPFYPGPGLGGHCVPIDPFYLAWKAREFEVPTRFIELAGEINTAMPNLVVERLARALDERAGRGLSGARVLLIGLAYKKNIEDTRESPSLRLWALAEARGAEVAFHDPHVPVIPPTREHPALAGRRSVPLEAAAVAAYDAVLVATDHDDVDWALLAAEARLIIDTRNVFARRGLPTDAVVKA